MKNKLRALRELLTSRTWILITDNDASICIDFDRFDVYLQLQSLESLNRNLEQALKTMQKELKKTWPAQK